MGCGQVSDTYRHGDLHNDRERDRDGRDEDREGIHDQAGGAIVLGCELGTAETLHHKLDKNEHGRDDYDYVDDLGGGQAKRDVLKEGSV